MTARADVIRRYLDYLDACTRHAWNELPPFLAETLLVNAQSRTQAEYVADLMPRSTCFLSRFGICAAHSSPAHGAPSI